MVNVRLHMHIEMSIVVVLGTPNRSVLANKYSQSEAMHSHSDHKFETGSNEVRANLSKTLADKIISVQILTKTNGTI